MFTDMNEFFSSSEQETARLGRAIGDSLEAGTVLGLVGSLGAGKTRLTQAIGSSLGIADGQVVSPTFTIAVPHEGRLALLHLDAYRIEQPEEVDELGLDELAEEGVVLIVEWADRIEKYLPPLDLELSIEPTGSDSRVFRFSARTERGSQLRDAVAKRLAPSSGE